MAEETIGTLVELLANKAPDWGIVEYKAGINLKGHRDFSVTYCPGVLYIRLPEIASRANELIKVRNKEWDQMATKEEIEAACFEAARSAVWDQRGNIADAVFDKNIEGKQFYWVAKQGADAAWAANEALHAADSAGHTETPVLDQVRVVAEKQATMQQQLDRIEKMLANLTVV